MTTEKQLISETEKWLKKADAEFAGIKSANKKGAEFVKNIDAYLKDCRHFSEKKDYVRAFEAVIWAWAWIEIGKEIEVIETKNKG